MKKSLLILAMALLSLNTVVAQGRGDAMMKQARANLEQKDYTLARYQFIQALNSYIAEKDAPNAVQAAVEAARLYHRENFYKEAFEVLSKADAAVDDNVGAPGARGTLHYDTSRERLDMYVKLKNAQRARESLDRMKSAAGSDKAREQDLLYHQAAYSYAFADTRAGDAAVNSLITLYEQAPYESADSAFRALIDRATASKNARLLSRTYTRYNQWTDSMKTLRTRAALDQAAAEVAARDTEIADLNHTISVKTGIIVTLGIVIAALAALIVAGAVALARYAVKTRRMRRDLDTAIEHNRLKNEFIHNISAQLEPTLATLPQEHPAVGALQRFAADVQELSDLESAVDDPYETDEVNVQQFCEQLAAEVRPRLAQGVTLAVNAPKMSARFNAGATADILRHLLLNAALNTPSGGKITLEYRKRGARSSQFSVTDTGTGIPDDRRDTVFRPFTAVRDLTRGDGLGLPIASLRARRCCGSLSLDAAYSRGARFVLDLHC